jgi:hypothetical protein
MILHYWIMARSSVLHAGGGRGWESDFLWDSAWLSYPSRD